MCSRPLFHDEFVIFQDVRLATLRMSAKRLAEPNTIYSRAGRFRYRRLIRLCTGLCSIAYFLHQLFSMCGIIAVIHGDP